MTFTLKRKHRAAVQCEETGIYFCPSCLNDANENGKINHSFGCANRFLVWDINQKKWVTESSGLVVANQ